jgi:hypothetical protein
MRPDAHLIAHEINADFVAYLNGASRTRASLGPRVGGAD